MSRSRDTVLPQSLGTQRIPPVGAEGGFPIIQAGPMAKIFCLALCFLLDFTFSINVIELDESNYRKASDGSRNLLVKYGLKDSSVSSAW
jgi:hypothetical protein